MARVRRFLDSRGAPAHRRRRLVAVALVIALRGVPAPWSVHVDPDGAYVGSSLNILRGEHTQYLDHPGLPTQVGLAIASAATT
jgi:hypothetical protein